MSDSDFEEGTLVFDNGSGMMKCGFAGDDGPRVVFPTIIGRPRSAASMDAIDMEPVDSCIGEEAQINRVALNFQYPMTRGIVTNWEDMEKIWHHAFHNELRVPPEDYSIVLTEAPLNPKANRERMTKIMFEVFKVPAMCISMSAILSLHASGGTTGIVLDSGDAASWVVPIHEGFAVPHAIVGFDLAGRDLTSHMGRMLAEREGGCYEDSGLDPEALREIKETLCYIALDIDLEMKKGSEVEERYELPSDEPAIRVGSERFRCPEVLFNPGLFGKDCPSIHGRTFEAITKCNEELHEGLYSNVVLSGGNTMFAGMEDRMTKELAALAPSTMKINVVAPPERMYSPFLGGGILASQDTFKKMCINKGEFAKSGPTIVHSKCS